MRICRVSSGQLEELQGRLSALQSQGSEAQAELNRSREGLEAAQEECASLKAEVQRLGDELSSAREAARSQEALHGDRGTESAQQVIHYLQIHSPLSPMCAFAIPLLHNQLKDSLLCQQ